MEKLGLREHFNEVKTTAYSCVEERNGTVGSVHCANDINVGGNAEWLLRICKPYLNFLWLAKTL